MWLRIGTVRVLGCCEPVCSIICGEFVDQPTEELLAFQEGLFVLELL